MVRRGLRDVLGPAVDLLGEAAAVDEFEGEVGEATGLADVVDLDDIGVLEAGDGLGLPVEAGQGLGAGVGAGQDHLERDQTTQVDLAGLVNDPHAAAAQLLEDLEAGDGRPSGRSRDPGPDGVRRFERAGQWRRIACAEGMVAGRTLAQKPFRGRPSAEWLVLIPRGQPGGVVPARLFVRVPRRLAHLRTLLVVALEKLN